MPLPAFNKGVHCTKTVCPLMCAVRFSTLPVGDPNEEVTVAELLSRAAERKHKAGKLGDSIQGHIWETSNGVCAVSLSLTLSKASDRVK